MMNMSENDIKMFKALRKSEIGTSLVDYFNRLLDHVCDSRNWDENQTKADTDRIVRILRTNFIDKIELQGTDKKKPPYQFI